MLDPKHISEETELSLPPLDSDGMYVERAGPPLLSFFCRMVNFFKNMNLAKDVAGNVQILLGKTLSLTSGTTDAATCGLALAHGGGINGAWTTVGPIRSMQIPTTQATSTALIFLTFQSTPDNASGLSPWVQSRNGSGFVIATQDLLEDRDVAWMIIEQHAP